MNNNNQNNIQPVKNQPVNNSISALDALNKKLELESNSIPSPNPPSNAKRTTQSKNIKPVNKQLKPVITTLKPKIIIKSPIKKTLVNKSQQLIKPKPIVKIVKSLKSVKLVKSVKSDDSDDISDLDEQIRKLEMEINKKKVSKFDEQSIREPESKIELVVKKEIKESKIALIKLLLDAKKNQSSNDLEQTAKISEENQTINTYYQEYFNIDDYDETVQINNEKEVMNIEFNDPESAKLIKVIEDEDLNYSVPVNVKIRSDNPNNSYAISRNNVNNFVKGSIYVDIDCEKVTSSDCYNDYMADLEKKMKITNINIKNIELPINSNENINKTNNELKIMINNREQIFELEENYYNRYEIKEFLNEAFSAYNFNITCEIQDGIFIFTSENKFIMLNHDTSILPTLGFNKNAYVNKNTYIAENSHQIGDNIYYMVIENISSEPLFYINKDTDEIHKLYEIEPFETDNLIIKFNKSKKDLIKNTKEYKYFFNERHLITFELFI